MAGASVIAAVVAIVGFALLRAIQARQGSKNLPPGPPAWPLVGNLLQIPTSKAYLKFAEWSRTYGPIIGLNMGSQDLIVLNTASAVHEQVAPSGSTNSYLFDKRGAIYSSRPTNHIGAELITRDNTHLLLMPYGPEWRGQRKIYQSILNINAVKSLQPLQEAESILTMQQLSQDPGGYYDHIRRYSTAVILSSVFGIRGPTFNHPNVQRLYKVQDQFTAILETGATPPVDFFPWLKMLPTALAPWRKWALDIRAEQRKLYFELLQRAKDRVEKGAQRNCFIDNMLKEEAGGAKNALDDEHIAYVGGVLMEGGSDTTASTLLSFLMAMVKYPRVLQRAQQVVDKVCGTDRSPRFDDLEHLGYIQHCVDEVLRWRPVAAGGIPHSLIKDDTYNQFEFKKDTIFLANIWAINHDPNVYESPDEFLPERYEIDPLGRKEGSFKVDQENTRKTMGFGAGRRICPGQHLAENSPIINIAKLVWAFSITPGIHPSTGARLTVADIDDSIETQWTNGFLTGPKPFPVAIDIRSAAHQAVIDRECREAQEVFREYE